MTRHRPGPHRRTPILALALAAAALGGCDFKGPTNVNTPCPNGGRLAVRVSAGTEPTFSWTPEACVVNTLTVSEPTEPARIVWRTSGARSGVRYAGPPLVRGTRYRVDLDDFSGGPSGSASFTP